jgi:hypothetical protein
VPSEPLDSRMDDFVGSQARFGTRTFHELLWLSWSAHGFSGI